FLTGFPQSHQQNQISSKVYPSTMSHPSPLHSRLYGTSTTASTPTWASAYQAWQSQHHQHPTLRPSTPPATTHDQTLSSTLALSSAFESFKLFISASRLLPQELSHEAAIGKLVRIVDEEVERE